MRAVIQTGYGPPNEVFELHEIQQPEIKPNEVLLKVAATSINGGAWHLTRGWPYVARLVTGLRRPKLPNPGIAVAGRIEAVGETVANLRPGQEVFGWGDGTLQEFVAIPASRLTPIPETLTPEEAASVPTAAVTALQGLRDGAGIKSGDRTLIVGASGGIGSYAVQLAAAFGAEVTAVCGARNAAVVQSLGASRVVDYTASDYTRSGEKYDVIFDIAGDRPISACRRVLSPRGRLVMVGSSGRGESARGSLRRTERFFMGSDRLLKGLAATPFVRQRFRPFIQRESVRDLEFLSTLFVTDRLRPVIARIYPLAEVGEAVQRMGQGAPGSTVVSV